MSRRGQSRFIYQLDLKPETETIISQLLLDAYRNGMLVIEYSLDGETWLSDNSETLIVSFPAHILRGSLS